MDKRTLEAVRYLGYGKHAVDDQTLALIRDSFEDLERVAKRRIVYRIFELKVSDEEHLNIEGLEITSRKRYSLTEMSRTVVLQACAAAMLEEYLNNWQKSLKEEMTSQGYFLRPRFSPGYGDFSILHQKDILGMLDCAKKIGLTMTESSMLTPTKSVTAVIGLGREEVHCHEEGCESCSKKDCIYRRN